MANGHVSLSNRRVFPALLAVGAALVVAVASVTLPGPVLLALLAAGATVALLLLSRRYVNKVATPERRWEGPSTAVVARATGRCDSGRARRSVKAGPLPLLCRHADDRPDFCKTCGGADSLGLAVFLCALGRSRGTRAGPKPGDVPRSHPRGGRGSPLRRVGPVVDVSGCGASRLGCQRRSLRLPDAGVVLAGDSGPHSTQASSSRHSYVDSFARHRWLGRCGAGRRCEHGIRQFSDTGSHDRLHSAPPNELRCCCGHRHCTCVRPACHVHTTASARRLGWRSRVDCRSRR